MLHLLNVTVMSLRHYLVSGRVQGVGYRRFVQKQALKLGIVGIVRNLQDGRVELVVRLTADQQSKLEKALWRGPMLSSVAEVQGAGFTESARLLIPTEVMEIAADGDSPWDL